MGTMAAPSMVIFSKRGAIKNSVKRVIRAYAQQAVQKAVATQRAILELIHFMIPPLVVYWGAKIALDCVKASLIAPGGLNYFRPGDLNTLSKFAVGDDA